MNINILKGFNFAGLLGGFYKASLWLFGLVLLGAVLFFIIKQKQYKYSATIIVEKEGDTFGIVYDRVYKRKTPSGAYDWMLKREKDRLPSYLVKEFNENKVLIYKDKEGNYKEPVVNIGGAIEIRGSDRAYAEYKINEAEKIYQKKATWEKLYPLFAWASVIILNVIGLVIISKLSCGG